MTKTLLYQTTNDIEALIMIRHHCNMGVGFDKDVSQEKNNIKYKTQLEPLKVLLIPDAKRVIPDYQYQHLEIIFLDPPYALWILQCRFHLP